MGHPQPALNCTAQKPITADTDIVGIGVLVAFFTTATLTVGANFFGYLSDSLHDSYMNDLDRTIITAYGNSYISQKIVPWLWAKWIAVKRVFKWLVGRTSSLSEQQGRSTREMRRESLARFVLALSDQQLVTGLAILIGGVANQRKLTGYEFSVVVSLAWFSSTTHLATLDTLRHYFLQHKTLRDWRVIGMVMLLILLLYCFLVNLRAEPTVPVQCLFSGPITDISRQYYVSADPLGLSSIILTILLLLSNYINRIQGLYKQPRVPLGITCRLAYEWGKRQQGKSIKLPYEAVKTRLIEEIMEQRCLNRIAKLERLGRSNGDLTRNRSKFILAYTMDSYHDSFLSQLPGIAFSFSYGISQIVLYRWMLAPELSDDGFSMDFGQITPLLLLIIPVFASAEIHYDYRDEQRPDRGPLTGRRQQQSSQTSNRPSSSQSNSIKRQRPFNADDMFDDNIDSIKRFFHKQVNSVLERESNAVTEEDFSSVYKEKVEILSSFQDIKAQEPSYGTKLCLLYFLCDTAILITLGILLNVTKLYAYLLGIVMFVARFGLWAAGVLSDMIQERILAQESMRNLQKQLSVVTNDPSTSQNSPSKIISA